MIKVHNNARAECAGRRVQIFRFDSCDVAISRWRKRVNVHVFVHGSMSNEAVWVRIQHSNGSLWDCDARDVNKFLQRDPQAQIMPASKPYAVIAVKHDSTDSPE